MTDFFLSLGGPSGDVRLILISDDSTDPAGICVPAPLGSGSCPADEALPSYQHIVQAVGSSNPLTLMTSTYDLYKDSLRFDSERHFVVVSDGDSSIADTQFVTNLENLTPPIEAFGFQAIVASATTDPVVCAGMMPPGPCCGAQPGAVYQALVTNTNGYFGDFCNAPNFAPYWIDIASNVTNRLSVACTWDIPPAPAGETFDPYLFNVTYSDGDQTSVEIGRVPSVAECTGVADGWYYDSASSPSAITVCQSTCGEIRSLTAQVLETTFGCATRSAQ